MASPEIYCKSALYITLVRGAFYYNFIGKLQALHCNERAKSEQSVVWFRFVDLNRRWDIFHIVCTKDGIVMSKMPLSLNLHPPFSLTCIPDLVLCIQMKRPLGLNANAKPHEWHGRIWVLMTHVSMSERRTYIARRPISRKVLKIMFWEVPPADWLIL